MSAAREWRIGTGHEEVGPGVEHAGHPLLAAVHREAPDGQQLSGRAGTRIAHRVGAVHRRRRLEVGSGGR
jgi:hypothetical protein